MACTQGLQLKSGQRTAGQGQGMEAHLVDVRAPSGVLSAGLIACRVAARLAAPHGARTRDPRTRVDCAADPTTKRTQSGSALLERPGAPDHGSRVAVELLSLPCCPRAPPPAPGPPRPARPRQRQLYPPRPSCTNSHACPPPGEQAGRASAQRRFAGILPASRRVPRGKIPGLLAPRPLPSLLCGEGG